MSRHNYMRPNGLRRPAAEQAGEPTWGISGRPSAQYTPEGRP
jgi:hypothetical protein